MKKHKKHDTETNPFKSEEDFQPETEMQQETAPEDEFEKMKQDFDELNNQYLRLAADFDNFRKRQANERENLLNYGKAEALTVLLEVLDNFDRAKQSFNGGEDAEQVKQSLEVLNKQVFETMQKLGLSQIETENQKFDPNFHDAVMQTPSNDYEDQTIIQELQKGYKLGDKVLRPALVNVAVNE